MCVCVFDSGVVLCPGDLQYPGVTPYLTNQSCEEPVVESSRGMPTQVLHQEQQLLS